MATVGLTFGHRLQLLTPIDRMAQFENSPAGKGAITFKTVNPWWRTIRSFPSSGDGTGVDIWPATQAVLDAVAKAYGSKRIEWFKVYAGDEACELYGTYQYLPDTLEAIRRFGVAIKAP